MFRYRVWNEILSVVLSESQGRAAALFLFYNMITETEVVLAIFVLIHFSLMSKMTAVLDAGYSFF